MIRKKSEIEELYNFRHFNDNRDKEDFAYDYENKLLSNIMSNVMFKNDITANFLKAIEKTYVWMIESTLTARNFFNYTVDKYYNEHRN